MLMLHIVDKYFFTLLASALKVLLKFAHYIQMENMVAEIIKCCSHHVIPNILSGEGNLDFMYAQCLELQHDLARQEHHVFLLPSKFSQTCLNYLP